MAEDDARRPEPHDPGGRGVVALRLDHHLRADEPRVGDPADDAHRDVEIEEAGPEHRDDGDDEDEERHGDAEIDEAAEHGIEDAAAIADERPRERPEHQGEHGREDRDLQVDRRSPR